MLKVDFLLRFFKRVGRPFLPLSASFSALKDCDASFTCPESTVSVLLAAQKNPQYFEPESHGKILTLKKIRKLIELRDPGCACGQSYRPIPTRPPVSTLGQRAFRYLGRSAPRSPCPRSACSAAEEDHHAEDETEVVPAAVVVHFVQLNLLIEERDDERHGGDDPVP